MPEAAHQVTVTDFLMNIIPTTMVDAFAKGNILQVLLVAILFGFALSMVGPKCKPVAGIVRCHDACGFRRRSISL